jgi:hypothetical protein
MGALSPFVNAWACIWTLFVAIIFILPTVRPVTANTMNYASVFIVFILGAAALFWYTSGRKFYHGPIIEAQIDENDSQSDQISGVPNDKLEKEAMV